MRIRFLASIAAISLASASQMSLAQDNGLIPTADWALINGRVHTMDANNSIAEAIAVEDDTIVYVGDEEGLRNYIGLGTHVIDVHGEMVLPGFIDAHTHLVGGAFVNSGANLLTDDADEVVERMRQYVADNPDQPFYIGYGLRRSPWLARGGLPTKDILDQFDTDKPIYIWAVDGHAALVNSKALEVAGITKDTEDPVPGFAIIHRDSDGNPNGWLEEPPAQMLVFGPVVNPNEEFILKGTRTWLPRIAAAGVTSVQDLGIQGMSQEDGFKLFTNLDKDGEMPFRVKGVYYWNNASEDPLVTLRRFREEFHSEHVTVSKLKVNVDGADDSHSGLYVEPYVDKPDAKPNPIIPPEVIKKVVTEADREGINVVCHCWGDLAVRHMLDAYENAIETNPPREDRRFVVSHGSSVHADDILRFAQLGVVYDTSGAWMANDPTLVEISRLRLGAERQDDMYPAMKIIEAGGKVSFGSDWPVSGYLSEYRPLTMIRTAVTRRLPGLDDRPPLGGESAKMPLQEALRASTINAAYNMGIDDITGSLEVGKKADIVVLEEDLFDVDPYKIDEVKVLYTMMGGQLTYDHRDDTK
ncbi:amidohydrolase [Altererythrobacter sp.]|uniref:amidohydrolase n=1 Tax=Altererythrobacter sp. TaxID=1872480 RepID=UPI003D0A25DE